jgi:hypothetical protein
MLKRNLHMIVYNFTDHMVARSGPMCIRLDAIFIGLDHQGPNPTADMGCTMVALNFRPNIDTFGKQIDPDSGLQ